MMFRFLATLALALPLFAQTMSIDQMLSMKTVARPHISPDGRFVAYDVTEADWKNNAYVAHLWLADTQSGRAFQLTRGKKSSGSAQWSPDGRWLAFLTEREASAIESEEKKDDGKPDARQIWLIAPGGGEAWQLTKHAGEIDSFRWSEDGKRIAFTAPVPESKQAKARKEKYADFEIVEQDYDQNQLWVVDVAAAEKEQRPVDAGTDR